MIAQQKAAWDVEKVRQDFPILSRSVGGKKLVYLDNAATSQKPVSVLERLDRYWREENANVHRGVHALSQIATRHFDESRAKVRRFLDAEHTHEIIFTKGCTEGINLVAQSYARNTLKARDEILVTTMEHHSNIVPWQIVAEQTGANIKVIPVNELGELELADLDSLLTERTKIVGVVHVSNSIGTVNPVKHIISKAHAVGAVVWWTARRLGPTRR